MPSRQPHAMDATGVGLTAVLLVEAETAQGRAITTKYVERGIAAIPDRILDAFAPELLDAPRDCSDALLIEKCQRLLRASLTLEEVAREVCLSPSRFRHVFVAETGMALRPYVLWRRFLYVWELLAAGTSLSKAAPDAGFSDAAHLSRTSRTMFGFPPSALHIERPVTAPIVPGMRAGSPIVAPVSRPKAELRRPLRDRMVSLA